MDIEKTMAALVEIFGGEFDFHGDTKVYYFNFSRRFEGSGETREEAFINLVDALSFSMATGRLG